MRVSESSVSGAAPMEVSRRAVLSGIALAALSVAVSATARAEDEVTAASGLKYKVSKKGDGPKIVSGDLVAIRFKGSYNDVAFDDIFETPQPYFYRAGSDLVLKVRPVFHSRFFHARRLANAFVAWFSGFGVLIT
jgi:hypothetical protein